MNTPIGRPSPRREDARLLSGRGKYLADVRVPGALEAAFVRSPVAHGTITALDPSRALDLDGVAAVFTDDTLPGACAACGRSGNRRPPQDAPGATRFWPGSASSESR